MGVGSCHKSERNHERKSSSSHNIFAFSGLFKDFLFNLFFHPHTHTLLLFLFRIESLTCVHLTTAVLISIYTAVESGWEDDLCSTSLSQTCMVTNKWLSCVGRVGSGRPILGAHPFNTKYPTQKTSLLGRVTHPSYKSKYLSFTS